MTRPQEELFTYYMEYFWENQRPPTVRNLCKKFEYKSTNGARQHLKLIAKKVIWLKLMVALTLTEIFWMPLFLVNF